ncbi:NUDIX hydrolase [Neorhodopirellula lusitana]|uniref:NUDIX hydrolase n=1 Tax=Neorhodopirellula lusitana TaxID=445327 RepID=UPI0038512C04
MSDGNSKVVADSLPFEQVFRFCPRCGHESETVGKIPFRCSECHFSFFFGPVAAVGGLVVNSRNELLLVRRAKDPGKGKWGLPGGFVDRGETVEDALAREVMEETSLVVSDAAFLMTGPNRYAYAGVTADVIDLFYTCNVEDDSQVVLQATELNHYQWCVPGADVLDNMAFDSNRTAVEFWMSRSK